MAYWHVRTCCSLGIITSGSYYFMDVDLAERASLLHPRLQFRAGSQDLAVGFPILVQQTSRRAKGIHVPFNLAVHRPILYEEPAAGPDERGNAFEDGLGIRELYVHDFSEPRQELVGKKKIEFAYDVRERGGSGGGRRRKNRPPMAVCLLGRRVVGNEHWTGLACKGSSR
jgi:hypothetical protein